MSRPKIIRPCKVNKCLESYYSMGFCRSHYNQQWRLTSFKQINREARLKHERQNYRTTHPLVHPIKFCSIDNCFKKYFSKKLCKSHYDTLIARPRNAKKHKEYVKKWYVKNNEHLIQKRKIWWASLSEVEKERKNAYHRKWQKAKYAADPAGELLKVHARRSKTNGVKINKEEICNWFTRICGICNRPIEDKFHIDHKTPLSRGGLHVVDNLQLSHPICNWSKNNKLQSELNLT